MDYVDNQVILDKRQQYLFPANAALYKKPIQIVRAKGSRVWDEKNREYLDAIGGIVTISVGHNHPRIKKRIQAMLADDAIQHTSTLYLNLYLAELAEKLASIAPDDLQKCYFTNSGSEANELAIMTARVSTGEQMVIALRHGYHGGTSVPMALCGHKNWKFPHQPQAAVTHAMAPYCYRCPFGATPGHCQLECAEDVKRVIETTTHGKIAAVIIEPIMGVGGFIDPSPDYHRRVYDITKEYGGLYISDEVQTGVGRTGKNFFAIQDSDVTPDFITMAKGLGNGAPIGGVITKSKYADALTGKTHFNTFGGDPYQSMQALETVSIIEDERLIEHTGRMGQLLKEGLLALQREFPLIGDVRGRGLMQGLELVTDRKSKEVAPQQTMELLELAKDEGLLLGKGGLYGNVVRIAPPLSISEGDVGELLSKLSKSFAKLGKPSLRA